MHVYLHFCKPLDTKTWHDVKQLSIMLCSFIYVQSFCSDLQHWLNRQRSVRIFLFYVNTVILWQKLFLTEQRDTPRIFDATMQEATDV